MGQKWGRIKILQIEKGDLAWFHLKWRPFNYRNGIDQCPKGVISALSFHNDLVMQIDSSIRTLSQQWSHYLHWSITGYSKSKYHHFCWREPSMLAIIETPLCLSLSDATAINVDQSQANQLFIGMNGSSRCVSMSEESVLSPKQIGQITTALVSIRSSITHTLWVPNSL